jgi:hypothetical protein
MSESKRSNHIISGVLIGLGVGMIIFGFGVWIITNNFLETFVSWAEDHGYVLRPSAFFYSNQISIISAIIIVLGFTAILTGTIIEMRTR